MIVLLQVAKPQWILELIQNVQMIYKEIGQKLNRVRIIEIEQGVDLKASFQYVVPPALTMSTRSSLRTTEIERGIDPTPRT